MGFSGLCGGERIREAVNAALAGRPLPDGFEFDQTTMWWEGLNEGQRNWAWGQVPSLLLEALREVLPGRPVPPGVQSGDSPWWDGLSENERQLVLARMPAKLVQLARKALDTV